MKIFCLFLGLALMTYSICALAGICGHQSPGWIVAHIVMIGVNGVTVYLNAAMLWRQLR